MELTIKNPDGSSKLTTPHYGYLTSKVASDYYRRHVLPMLYAASNDPTLAQVKQRYPNYDFTTDPVELLKQKSFRDVMLVLYRTYQNNFPVNQGLIEESLNAHATEIPNLQLQAAQGRVELMDPDARQQDVRRRMIAEIKRTPRTKNTIIDEFHQRDGQRRNYGGQSLPVATAAPVIQVPQNLVNIAPPQYNQVPIHDQQNIRPQEEDDVQMEGNNM
jgi:hypothetical protein